jgi:hypothetical protein
MTEFAIIDSGVIVAFRDLDEVPSLEGKPYRQVLPVVTTNPSYDPTTQAKTGPVVTIAATEVTRVWTVTDKSPAQIQAETDARRDGIVAGTLDVAEDILRAVLSVIVDEFNRHSERDATVKAQTALATSLANFQTRMAAINVLPSRTLADLRTAVRQKLGT